MKPRGITQPLGPRSLAVSLQKERDPWEVVRHSRGHGTWGLRAGVTWPSGNCSLASGSGIGAKVTQLQAALHEV